MGTFTVIQAQNMLGDALFDYVFVTMLEDQFLYIYILLVD